MRELDCFYKERSLEFKAPKLCGEPPKRIASSKFLLMSTVFTVGIMCV